MNDMQEIIDRFGWAENQNVLSGAAIALALARHVDARLTALEAKQAPLTDPGWYGLTVTPDGNVGIGTPGFSRDTEQTPQVGSEQRVARLQRDAETQYDRADTAEAEVKRLTTERNALAAQLDDLRNVNAGLRKDNERQSELIAALRQNSADLVESMKYLLSEAEPNKERMAALESLQDENATLRSRLAATSRQTDEIKRLEAVCDDLSDKLDAANEKIAALR